MSDPSREIGTLYSRGDAIPWVPFGPLTEEVLLRYYRIDQCSGEILVSVRAPPGYGPVSLYQTGPIVAHTIRGAWRLREGDWVARAGDTVSQPAGSIAKAETLGKEEVEIFLVISGELLFFDEDGGLAWEEGWRTSVERYEEHCRRHRLHSRDLTSLPGRD